MQESPYTKTMPFRFWLSVFIFCMGTGLLVGATGARSDEAGVLYARPSTYDRTKVSQLIRDVEDPQSGGALKAYFGSRETLAYPKTDAFVALKAAQAEVAAGSKQWFALQSMRAFAGLRINSGLREEGFGGYELLFTRYDQALRVGADEFICQAVADLTAMQTGSYGRGGFGIEKRSEEVLLQALKAYLGLIEQNRSCSQKILWTSAIWGHDQHAFWRLIEARLKDPRTPKTYELLKTAALLYADADFSRFLALMNQARALLPQDNLTLVEEHLKLVVNGLYNRKRFAEAIVPQKEIVSLTGRGFGKLGELYYRSGHKAEFEAMVEKVRLPGASDEDVRDLSLFLIASTGDSPTHGKYKDQALEIIMIYLKTNRKRDLNQEWRIRHAASAVYMERSQWEEARAVLRGNASPLPDAASEGYLFYSLAQGRLKKIEATLKGIKASSVQ